MTESYSVATGAEKRHPIASGEREEDDNVVVKLRVQPGRLCFVNDIAQKNLMLDIYLHGVPSEHNSISPIRSPTESQQWDCGYPIFDYSIRASWLKYLDPTSDDATQMNHRQKSSLRRQMFRATKYGLLFPYRTATRTLPLISSGNSSTSSLHRDLVGSLEFVLWSMETNEKSFVCEYSLSLRKWAVAHSEHVAWPSFPLDISLAGNDGKKVANLEIQVGLLPVKHSRDVTLVSRALQKMLGEEDLDPYHTSSTQPIGMREESEDFADDGITDEDLWNDEDLTSDSELEPLRKTLDALTLQPYGEPKAVPIPKNALEQKEKLGILQDSRIHQVSNRLEARLASDTDAETDVNKRTRILGRPNSRSTGSRSDSGSLPRVSTSAKPQKRARRRRMHGNFKLKTIPKNDLLGIVMIEIISAHNLPRWRNITNTSFDMDPFVVVSFHRKVFRTRVLRHTLNPEWREKLLLHVHKNELGYIVRCAVYDWDKISANDYVGEISLDLHDIMSAAPIPNPVSGLYRLDDMQQTQPMYYNLPLKRERGDEEQKFGSRQPTLQMSAVFQPYGALRQRFWLEMMRLYDTNETGGIGIDELQTMLLSLESTLTEKTIKSFFSRFGKEAGKDELTFAEGIQALETELLRPKPERQTVDGLDAEGDVVDDLYSEEEDEPVERVIQLSTCPLCLLPRLSRAEETDIVTHLALCTSRKGRSVDDIMVSNFVTASQARRKWYTNAFTILSQGHYRIGANSANILVQDRLTGQVIEEKMQVYVRLGIRLLYQGARSHMNGARVRRMLRNMTFRQGLKYDHPNSVRAIAPFISFHGIKVEEMMDPVESFTTFNEFFCRRIRMSLRPLDEPDNPCVLVSCADCRLSAFENVDRATAMWIKGRQFSIGKLLGETYQHLAPREPSLVIFRLAPQDYHRFHSPVDGVLGEPQRIEGEYYTVNPMAIRSNIDVFGENTRAVVPIYTKEFGTVILTAIGAMMVGSIVFTIRAGDTVKRGDELGYFRFGGSTLVLLVERSRVRWDTDLLANASACMETLVRVGMRLGKASHSSAE